MLTLELENGLLSLSGDEIDQWDHNLFFTISLGFDLSYKSNKLTLPEEKDLHLTTSLLRDYLQDKAIEFEASPEVKKLLSQIVAEEREFRYAVHVSRQLPSLKTPKTFVRKLKPYQQKGYEHLVAVKHSANFSVPGSGKTTVVYAAFSHLKELVLVDKLLVIGPLSSFMPWEEEAEACYGKSLPTARLSGTKNSRQSIYLQVEDYDVFLCGYQAAANDESEIINHLLKRFKFMMVIDESHNIKRFHEGIWAEAMLRLSRYAVKRSILTGTPAPNSYLDLWSQFTFLWPTKNVLGSKDTYLVKAEDKNSFSEIKKAIKPFVFRVTKTELKLPKPTFKYYSCEMKPYQMEIYRAIATKFLTELNFTKEVNIYIRGWRRAKMIRLIQTASNPTLLARYSSEFDIKPVEGVDKSLIDLIEKYPEYEVPTKFEKLKDIVISLVKNNKKVVIWTSFILNILSIKNILDALDIPTFIIYGAVPKDEDADVEFNREQQIRDFKASKAPCVLLANPAACAESISLHRICHDAIYVDRTFDCGQYLQSLDRLHRIGLTPKETVNYHILVASDSIDETIDRRLKEKEQNMLKILESDLPVGGMQAEENTMAISEEEEIEDYDQSIKDLKEYYK